MRTSESTVKLVEAVVQARAAFKPVVRDLVAQASATRTYLYADLAGILDAVMPALLAHGLVIFQCVDAETATLVTRLAHTSGEFIESTYPLKFESAQAAGSWLTYARRYSISALLNIAALDDDGAAADPKPATKKKPATVARLPKNDVISEPQRKRLFAVAKASGWTTDQMKAFLRLQFGLETTTNFPRAKYDAAIAAFEVPPIPPEEMPL
jgi:hypothetical protein